MLSSVFMSPLGSLCRTHLVQGDWEGGFLPEFFIPEKGSHCFLHMKSTCVGWASVA